MSTPDKAAYLLETKQEIAQALIDQGQMVEEYEDFRSYAAKIRAIKSKDHAATADRATEADNATEAKHAKVADKAGYADLAGNIPNWDVKENVGAISPTTSMVLKVEGRMTSQAHTVAGKNAISFPMINSGTVYLCCKAAWSTFGLLANKFTINTSLEVYVNGVFSFKYDYTKTSNDITYGATYRAKLDVVKGDVVSLVVHQTLDVQRSGVNSELEEPPTASVTVSGIQLKANIATVHKYLSLDEDLELSTAKPINDSLLEV